MLLQVANVGYEHPMVFNCQMGAGRTTTGTVIGGLLAMYGSTIQLPGGAAAEDGSTGGAGAAAGAAGGGGGALTPVRALLASMPSSTSMDDLSKDIIREELAGDSPRHSGETRQHMWLSFSVWFELRQLLLVICLAAIVPLQGHHSGWACTAVLAIKCCAGSHFLSAFRTAF
jgi:hypothetical protein